MTIQYISTDKELAGCLAQLKKSNEIALDLEFDKNRYRYGFNLCLVQAYSNETCFLIDPLSDSLNIEKLFPVLESGEIQKVVFAFGEDLRLLHSIGCFPRNIYDLSIATSLLNYPPASLSNYITDILELKTGSSSQQSNWYRRPLTDKQKHYAAQDVLHLLSMKEVIEEEARKKQITDWIAQENEVYNKLNYEDVNDNNFIKAKDKNGFTEFEWYLFKKLLEFREEVAKNYNKPSYQIIDKNYLSVIAKDPQRLIDWENTPGIFRSIKNERFKKGIMNFLKRSSREAYELNLSKSEPVVKEPCQKEIHQQKKERARINRIKNEYFKPIKARIAEDYGSETASYILSNRIMSELIVGEIEKLEKYKRELLMNCAKELNLDLNVILAIVE